MLKDFLYKWFWNNWVIKRVVIPYGTIYLLFALFGLFCADWLIFYRHKVDYGKDFPVIMLHTADGAQISATTLEAEKAKYTVIYSYGNGGDLASEYYNLIRLQKLGFNVFSYDYHGYGMSSGKPSERNCYADIDAAYKYVTEELKVPSSRVIIYGYSLGGGPSVDLASRKPVAGLILQSTYTSIFVVRTRVRLLPFDEFNNLDKINKVHCPLLIMHGRSDKMIAFKNSERLYQRANAPKTRLWVDGADHDNLPEIAGDKYTTAVKEFVASLP